MGTSHVEEQDHHHHMVHNHRDVQGGSARAAIFGVSDGLVSNVALILGVAAASTGSSTIADANAVLIAGTSGLLAGAASMAAGEYVSMKAQAELVERELEIERLSIANEPTKELKELQAIYVRRGVEVDKARDIAEAVMSDPVVALEVHAREELGVDPDSVGNPVAAAAASFVAFAVGALLPLLPWFFSSGGAATLASIVIGLIAAATVGALLARFTERSVFRTVARQVSWATGACVLTWGIGSWLGAVVA